MSTLKCVIVSRNAIRVLIVVVLRTGQQQQRRTASPTASEGILGHALLPTRRATETHEPQLQRLKMFKVFVTYSYLPSSRSFNK